LLFNANSAIFSYIIAGTS